MKILLMACNAKYIHSNLAVYSLRAYAGEYARDIVLKEYTINQQKDDIMKNIYLEKPDVICVSCYIWNITFVKELMRDLRKILPEVPFWAGGPEVSFDAAEFLQENPAFTGVLVGEGEETFLELAKYYEGKEPSVTDQENPDYGTADFGNIPGLVWRDGESIRHNGWREVLDLSTVPFVYQNLQEFKNRIIYYESSRGCPFSCSYCLSSVDKKLRFRDPELVKKELQFFLDNRVPQVKFVDRTFNCRQDHAMEIWKYISEHDNGITNFHFEISADLLRAEELALMQTMRPGLIQLEIGVQSTNPDTIREIRRTMNFERLKAVVNRIHSFGNIHQHLDLIAGLPYEDYGSFRKSFNDVYALRPQQLQLGFLKVLKGSYMKEKALEYGIVHKAQEPYEVLRTRWLSYEDVLKLKMVEDMVEVYYNSGQFENTMKLMEPLFEDAFGMYEALGRFYEKKGYDVISHSRMRRYEILLEFIKEEKMFSDGKIGAAGGGSEEFLEKAADCMILDLYLRENLKSRPAFGGDQKPWEKAVWEYRRHEGVAKSAHIEVFRDGRAMLFDYENRDPLTNNASLKEIWLKSL